MLVEAYLTYIRCELNLSVSTVLCYETALKDWRDFATDGKPQELNPFDMTVSDLRLWIAHLASKGMKPRSLRLKVQALRGFYRYLGRYHGAQANPAAELTLAKLDKPLPVFVKRNEMEQLLQENAEEHDEFISARNNLILTLFYETGIRCSELLALPDRWVDTNKGELKVLGKRNKERIVPFGERLANQIKNYRSLRNREVDENIDFLFVKRDGQPLSRNMVYRIVRDAMKNVGVSSQRKSPHVLRHTFATDMVNNGADLTAVQKLLGHVSLATTQIYTHTSFKELHEAYQKAHPRGKQ